jgi:predicted nuclease of predicted toxin-antitoxin system
MIDRLLADADLNLAIVTGLLRRSSAIDFQRAEEVPLEGLKDPLVLTMAATDHRVLVTHDVSTMPGHLREFVRARTSPGVIVIPQDLSVGKAIESLLLICGACEPADLENRVCLVPSLVLFGF